MAVRRRHISGLVERLIGHLEALNVPRTPVPIERLALELGAEIRVEPAPDDLSGFLYRTAAGEAVIGVNALHHTNRQRFTMAHELGHLLLHGGEPVHWDNADYGFRFRREPTDGDVPRDEEVESNYFAAELLMPAKYLKVDLGEFPAEDFLDDSFENSVLTPLAERYGVSKQAMTIRLQALGYILM